MMEEELGEPVRRVVQRPTVLAGPAQIPTPQPLATSLSGGRCVHCLSEPRLGKSMYGYKCIKLIKSGTLRKVEWNRCHCGNAKQATNDQCVRCTQLAAARA